MKIVVILVIIHMLFIIFLILVVGHLHKLRLGAWDCVHCASMDIEALRYFAEIRLLILLTSFIFLKLMPDSEDWVNIYLGISFRIFDDHHGWFISDYRLLLGFLPIICWWFFLKFLLVFRRLVLFPFTLLTFF